jgi:hypothetical protein
MAAATRPLLHGRRYTASLHGRRYMAAATRPLIQGRRYTATAIRPQLLYTAAAVRSTIVVKQENDYCNPHANKMSNGEIQGILQERIGVKQRKYSKTNKATKRE